VDLSNLVGNPGVEQDPFRGRGLAGIDVRHDADVPSFVERYLPRHFNKPEVGDRRSTQSSTQPFASSPTH
jgi:hypothetical protein